MLGFELIRSEDIPELRSRAQLFRHTRTGAELLSLENTDENKVFGITFRTPPSDSTGVAHILEHSVLCGSRKYPLKDPFTELWKGSLHTFLNAMTFPDKTCYPVASQNIRDFYNLVDVYLDTVFHPLLKKEVFHQEGWHYHRDGEGSLLSYKGVVFNEMKGAYSSPDDVLGEYARQSLFPETAYCHDSGGHPGEIPQLTHAQFKAFHEAWYHPSNARLFFWGDDEPHRRLKLAAEYLDGHDRIEVASLVDLQPCFPEPGRMTQTYDPGTEEDAARAMVTVNWVLAETADTELALALEVLGHILIGTPASPLRKALIESGLGEDLAGFGLEMDLRQMAFSTGLKGVDTDRIEQIEPLILETLASLVQDGLETETISASLNTVEFALRENNTGGYPRGLMVMLRSLRSWLYDGDPLGPIAFEHPLAILKIHLETSKRYFEKLIAELLLENPHRTTLQLVPAPGLSGQLESAEKNRLEELKTRMTEDDRRSVTADLNALKIYQETPDPPDAVASIPVLSRMDLEREGKKIPREALRLAGANVLFHELDTTGIVYLDLGFDLHALPERLLPFAPLYGRALLEMGTEDEDFVRLSQRIGSTTGGIQSELLVSSRWGGGISASFLFLRGKAMAGRSRDLLAILIDVVRKIRLDNQERFLQMALEAKARLEASLIPRGNRLVDLRLRSCFDEAGWVNEQTSGVSQVFFLRRLIERVEQDWPAVLGDLEEIHTCLMQRSSMAVNLTSDREAWNGFVPCLEGFLAELPEEGDTLHTWEPKQARGMEGLAAPSSVNFVGKSANLYQLGYQIHGSSLAIQNYLSSTWLWESIRVKGGAYGGFCSFDPLSGVFSYLSYRDPNLIKTLENFDRTPAFLRGADLSETEITKAVIGAIGTLDSHLLPDAKGFLSLKRSLTGYAEDTREKIRGELLGAEVEDFQNFANALEGVREQGNVVALGSRSALEAANQECPGLLDLVGVL